ncbi:ubiquitin carboxyl-terminal hydrolase 6 isoform X2 [Prunus yedoensis var. nudiflora]|uniref:ubiquitinyl hydrolase 1 n=1 Tax=Prunus yedoensis var. nudiflora TaxID=2094558 RepID=A0A314UEL8_PRUYE|nr:ubiquitin carboxyl-terminal hydrolase 6 isoform X2 [Prunus yedoensis var. nudiflora]
MMMGQQMRLSRLQRRVLFLWKISQKKNKLLTWKHLLYELHVQCLHSVPELKSALIKYSHSGRSNDVDQTSHMLTIATRDLFGELDKSVKAVAPMQFWMVLRKKYPQFGQLHNNTFMQQDAEECWTQLLYTLSQSLRSSGSSESPDTVKALFGVELVSRVHCVESGEESSETESVYSLKCHISHEVNHLHEGLKHALKSELEKNSPSLGRSAIYLKESRINGLPRYLTIQFVRFFWKRESNQKAKILRKVDYPLQLDIFDLCSDDLRKRLEAPRRTLRDEEGKKLGLKSNEKSSGSKDNDIKMSDVEGSSNGSGEASNPTPDEGAMTGIYDLVAVLTHRVVVLTQAIMLPGSSKKVGNGSSMTMTIPSHSGRKTSPNSLEEVIGIWPIFACTRPVLSLCDLSLISSQSNLKYPSSLHFTGVHAGQHHTTERNRWVEKDISMASVHCDFFYVFYFIQLARGPRLSFMATIMCIVSTLSFMASDFIDKAQAVPNVIFVLSQSLL